MRLGPLLGSVLVVGGLTAFAWAHEERLVIGTVQRLDLQGNLLVVHDPERDQTLRLVLDSETQIERCRRRAPLVAVQPGAQVRVKYVDAPGREFEALSILVLPGGK